MMSPLSIYSESQSLTEIGVTKVLKGRPFFKSVPSKWALSKYLLTPLLLNGHWGSFSDLIFFFLMAAMPLETRTLGLHSFSNDYMLPIQNDPQNGQKRPFSAISGSGRSKLAEQFGTRVEQVRAHPR